MSAGYNSVVALSGQFPATITRELADLQASSSGVQEVALGSGKHEIVIEFRTACKFVEAANSTAAAAAIAAGTCSKVGDGETLSESWNYKTLSGLNIYVLNAADSEASEGLAIRRYTY